MTDILERLDAAGNGDRTWRGALILEARDEIKRLRARGGGLFQAEFAALLRDRDRHPEGDETRSGSVERSEIEPGAGTAIAQRQSGGQQ